MELVKEAGDFKIYKKRNSRYCVKDKRGKFLNGLEKTKILLDANLIKAALPKAKPVEEPAAAQEAPAEETETPAEE